MLNRVTKPLIILTVLVSILLAGCGGTKPGASSGGSEPKEDPAAKTITFALSLDIDTLDPQQVNTTYTPHNLLFSFPVTLGLKKDQPYPYMCESAIMSDDGIELTFTFPENMTFSNGKKVTGADYIAAIERYIETSPYASDFDEVVDMKSDGQTATLVFSAPNAYFWPVVATAYGAIVDVEAAEAAGKEAFGQKPVGFGPFILKEWVRGSQIVMTQNPDYIDNTPFVENHGPWHFDTAIVRIIPDDFTRINELESGNVDVSDVPAEYVERVEANPNLKLIKAIGAGQAYLKLNTEKAPFDNAKFREALNFAIDREEIKTAWKGGVEPVYGLLSPAQLCYSEQTNEELKAKNSTDTEKAKAILAELGYKDTNNDGYLDKDGKNLSFTIQGTTANRIALTVLQAQLKAIGIELKVMEQAAGVMNQAIRDRNFDITVSTWSWDDPDIWFYTLHSEGSTGAAVWHTPETDKMLEAQRAQVDPVERTATWSALSKTVGEEYPIIPLFYYVEHTAVRANIEGYQVATDGHIYWNDAVKK